MNNTEEIKNTESCECGHGCHHQEVSHECHCDNDKPKKKNRHESKELDEAKKMIVELQSKLMYSQAENINYRKRKEEETANILKYANQDLIMSILEVIDNFDRAASMKTETEEGKKIQTGMQMINNQFHEILNQYGVTEIEALGYPFDANYMEAMMVDNDAEKPDDMVLDVLRKGYKLKDRVIKPAVVKVNKIEDSNEKGND